MAGRGRQRTSFGKRERERKRQEKQAAKRARRHHDGQMPGEPADERDPARTEPPRGTEQ
jgi:hypothetical protein